MLETEMGSYKETQMGSYKETQMFREYIERNSNHILFKDSKGLQLSRICYFWGEPLSIWETPLIIEILATQRRIKHNPYVDS